MLYTHAASELPYISILFMGIVFYLCGGKGREGRREGEREKRKKEEREEKEGGCASGFRGILCAVL